MTLRSLIDVLQTARVAWAADHAAIATDETDEVWRDRSLKFGQSLERAYAVGWDLSLRPVMLAELSRTSGMVNGPLFTSDAYPWPTENGYLAIPIIQLDLARVSRVSRMPLGEGMLQLWHGASSMITRVIPPQHLQLPTDIPTLIPDQNLEIYHFRNGYFGVPSFLVDSYQIVGFDGPYLFGSLSDDETLDRWIASAAVSKPLKKALERLKREVARGRTEYRQVSRIFGSFDGIQIHPEDRPPALFSTDDHSIFNLGDAGVISLYYDLHPNGATFSADFQSC